MVERALGEVHPGPGSSVVQSDSTCKMEEESKPMALQKVTVR